MGLDECISKHTHRQYRTRLEWMDEQWNHPTLNEYYLMQIAAEVRRVLAKHPNEIQSDHFKIKFKRAVAKSQEQAEKDKQAKITANKMRWAGFVGIKLPPPKGQ